MQATGTPELREWSGSAPKVDSQNFCYSASVRYSPIFVSGRVATRWPYLYIIIVHPYIIFYPERQWREATIINIV
eukprot:6212975-Pleurochrysis_carterae.AAC.2